MELYIQYKDFDSEKEISAYFLQKPYTVISIETVITSPVLHVYRVWYKSR